MPKSTLAHSKPSRTYISCNIDLLTFNVTNLQDLLKGEHVVVEELLELLVDVVDADLFKAIVVEDLEPGDVEDTNVGDLLHGGVAQGLVTLVHLCQKCQNCTIGLYQNEENARKSTC